MDQSNSAYCFNPIGFVRADVPDEQVAKQRSTMISTLEILPQYSAALLGLDSYSHIIVLFWMHQAGGREQLQYHPRGDERLPKTGVLASRGRNHPNPVGLAVAELVNVDDVRLTVRRVDAFDGTPIIDIKPYDNYDVVTHPRVPAWFQQRQNK